MRNAVVVSVATILAGCAFSAQEPVVVKPELVTHQSSIGSGKTVYVNVVDERASKVLGTRGARGVGAELTAADSLVDSVRDSVSQGLRNQGFAIAAAVPPDGRTLRVEVRDLEYNVAVGFWSGTLRAQCALKATCQVGPTLAYDKLFRGEHEESVQVVQGSDANVRYINDAVSKAVNQLVDDPELGQCLASVPDLKSTAR